MDLLLVAVIVLLMLFCVYKDLYYFKHLEKLEERALRERQELLDRIMSVDFTQFKQGQMLNNPATFAQMQALQQTESDFGPLE